MNSANKAIEFLKKRGYPIPIDILMMANDTTTEEKISIVNHLKNLKASGDYAGIRNTFWASVYDNVYGYLDSSLPITKFKMNISTSLSQAYIEASELAWVEGGSELPIEPDVLAWAKAELNAQLSYVDSLFEKLKALRKEGDADVIHEAFIHADGYASSLDSFFNYIKTAAARGRMLTFVGSDGKESCRDCKRLKGQRKRASWWVSHDMVPPSHKFECGGYRCDHYLIDDNGNEFTV